MKSAQLQEQILGKINAILFDEHLIISFNKKWIDVFHSMPSFTLTIDSDNRLCLRSQPIPKSEDLCE